MQKWASTQLGHVSSASYKRFVGLQREPNKLLDDLELRNALLEFIADFADWENSTSSPYLQVSRKLTLAAHRGLAVTPGDKPFVFDPFAGGGAIPLEGLRIGADVYASDLNPLAVLINQVVLHHVPLVGQRLLEELDKCADWIKKEARSQLEEFYPADGNGDIPIAYLWARTILSEAPGTSDYPIEVPLIRSMWLTRGRGADNWAIRWVKDKANKVKTEIVEHSDERGVRRKVRRPVLEVFRPLKAEEVPSGTVRGGAATCPVTGFTTAVGRVRAQLSERQGGARDARMYCVVATSPGTSGRRFRVATTEDVRRSENASAAIRERHHSVPAEPLPPDGTNGFRVQKYGMRTWGDLFNSRQALALTTYSTLARRYVSETPFDDEQLRVALEAILALLVNRLADLNASLCGWQLNTPNSAHVFVRWALPMVFDFGEINPLAAAGGSPESALRRIKSSIEQLLASQLSSGTVMQHSATELPLADDMAAVFFTDPPYYDAIPYSDLMDFFVVWMKRVCQYQPFVLANGLSPKDEECVVDKIKRKERDFFQSTMTRALEEASRVLAPGGIGVVVFAHKSTSGWEAQLESLINAGLTVTASWPIDTEMGSRMRAQGSAALASSVHLVCRPRKAVAESDASASIGDWRHVLSELPQRIEEWMPRLTQEGIVGADAIFACLGPALEIFSRYSRVEKANGEQVKLKEYLEHVWAAVERVALNMIFEGADATGFEEDARLTAMWLWTLNAAGSEEDHASEQEEESDDETEGKTTRKGGYILEYDAARKMAQGLGAHLEKLDGLVEVKAEKARLLPVEERAKYLIGKEASAARPKEMERKRSQPDMFATVENNDEDRSLSDATANAIGRTVLDRVHQSMVLFGRGRGEALKRFLVEEGVGRDARFWRLAQALSALYPNSSSEKRWLDGVLARKKGLGF